jgi:arylsulfatase A-like enzyme
MKLALRWIVAFSTALAAGFAADAAVDPLQSDATRPDIVIVLTDQQRADAFGAAGTSELQTPAMDRLAAQGVLFTRAFAATPQCSPSRAALLTGRYPHRTGVMGNTAPKGPPAGMSEALDRTLPTLGRVFTAAGYETAYFGKWHLGGTPGEYGFAVHDSAIGDRTLARDVVAFLRQRADGARRKPLVLVVSWLDHLGTKPFPQRHYLQDDQGRPFVGADREIWRRYRAFYNGLVEKVDREIGSVLAALPQGRVAPITVFSTDHGDLGGSHGLPYKGPAMYEELVRVPLVISWPGRLRPARSDALVSLIDLLPTLCDLAGVPAPEGIDGISLRPVLDGRTRQPSDSRGAREMVFAEYYGKQSWRVPIRMVRTAQWKYVRYLHYGEELYDLAADPGELRNLARDAGAARERARLARALDEWIRRTVDPFLQLTVTDRSGKVVE